ncbi:Phosphotransferase enzyme family protein [Paenibacillus algorifonticola]|uniref:Phosphotransferase enzyme family protein n=1 Tax=Paenibacillus algorifonticola TaxID=684063 RepID=A0A1I1Z3Z7_9BACL|nr:aminoglycoside phosphotransferase family protein [Paenibacillus algorifonticola]SFE26574.1 Phosphotransferase enzyme family protein [Paenibacillus algorifonticola]
MDNEIKLKLDSQQLGQIAQHHFGRELAHSRELTDGWANTAYQLTLVDGFQSVLKVAPTAVGALMRYEQDMMKTEVEVMRLVSQDRRIPVPEVYAYDQSRSLVPTDYFIMQWLEGESYNKVKESFTQEEREQIEHQLGEYNACINEFSGEKFGYYPLNEAFASWTDAFGAMLQGVLDDATDAGVTLPAERYVIEQEVKERLPYLHAVTKPTLLHWDLWDGNIFIKDKRICGIIDFERAMWGDPLMEHYFSHFNLSETFLRGYGREALTAEEQIRRGLYDLYLDLILLIECAFRKYSDQTHLEWARSNATEGWERFLKLK